MYVVFISSHNPFDQTPCLKCVFFAHVLSFGAVSGRFSGRREAAGAAGRCGKLLMETVCQNYCWSVEVGSLSHHLQSFNDHPRWCSISAIQQYVGLNMCPLFRVWYTRPWLHVATTTFKTCFLPRIEDVNKKQIEVYKKWHWRKQIQATKRVSSVLL